MELGPGGRVTYVHSKVTSSRKKRQAGLADVAVCHLVVPAGNIQLHSLGCQTVMQLQAEEQSGHEPGFRGMAARSLAALNRLLDCQLGGN